MTLTDLAPGLAGFERTAPSGWPVGGFVLSLPSGGTLLHGPVWRDDATADAIAERGAPEVIVAPNHFHHLSLARYKARFPGARIVASDGARPRLARQRHLAGQDIGALAEVGGLPDGAEIVPLEGLKNGEAFLVVPLAGGDRGLVVCDAFFHVNRPVTGVTGLFVRATGTTPGLRIGKTFLWAGVRDRALYAASLRRTLARVAPKRIFFSHGEPFDVGDGAELERVIASRFGSG